MSTPDIVRRINETIKHPGISRDKKIERLKNLAEAYWKEVFPEYGTPAFDNIPGDEMAARWAKIREEDRLEQYENREQIFYVLDWPGSGGNFYWIK